MTQSAVTELIWHFAGYLHLGDELSRARAQFEEMNASRTALEFEAKDAAASARDATLDEFGSRRLPEFMPLTEEEAARWLPGGVPQLLEQLSPMGHGSIPALDLTRFGPSISGIVSGGGREGNVTRQEGGDDTNIDTDQYNLLSDNDRFGVPEHVTVTMVTGLDPAAEITSLQDMAQDAVPPGLLPLGGGNSAIIGENLAAAQIEAAASGEAPSTVVFGVHVNGVLQPQGSEPDDADDGTSDADERREGAPPPIPEQPDGWQPGDAGLQGAELGSNLASNGAIIIDADEACGTLVVLGDYFKTNAVVQVNVYADSDHVRIAGSGANAGPGAAVALGANEATNTADLSIRPLLEEVIDNRGLTGYSWNIDISYGDYYDVKSIYQENVINGNDVTCQTMTNAYYRVIVDANGQANAVMVEDFGAGYDLIVVLGNYYGGNFISQTNILLDNDHITVTAPGEGGSQTVYGGQNLLSNDGMISVYAREGFVPVSADFEAFIRSLETSGDISPEDWWSYSGSGSTEMNVLFVTGDYYDINLIEQVNIVSDADAAMQVGGEGADQFVSTGGNTTTNFAAIIDVGAYGEQFLGGEAYEEWTLIQTNIIASEDDELVIGDATQLASEVVAFAYSDDEDDQSTEAPLATAPAGGDELGHVLT